MITFKNIKGIFKIMPRSKSSEIMPRSNSPVTTKRPPIPKPSKSVVEAPTPESLKDERMDALEAQVKELTDDMYKLALENESLEEALYSLREELAGVVQEVIDINSRSI